MHLLRRIQSPGQKKILTCDGGGIRGLISVEILARMETELRQQLKKEDQERFVLADYFDFICGTSTGAIIAACLSAGMSTDQLRDLYVGSGSDMFRRSSFLERLRYSYSDTALAERLRLEFNRALGHENEGEDATLGDSSLRTLLMMVLRNHTTDSPWPITNNPLAKYNRETKDDGTPRLNCNLKLPLWQLVRASTAAPTYFPPETITLAMGTPEEERFVFVDGGLTTYNNPAFLAFLTATAAPYHIGWAPGPDQLLIVSVGTGSAPTARPGLKAEDLWLLDNAKNIPGALMNAAAAGWDMACRVVGECRFGGKIDREFGDMVVSELSGPNSTVPKQFAYVRYDPDVSPEGLQELKLNVASEDVRKLDSIDYIPQIQAVGKTYGARLDIRAHLKGFSPVA